MPPENRGYNPFHGFDNGSPPPKFGHVPPQPPPVVNFGGYWDRFAVHLPPPPPQLWGFPLPIVQPFPAYPAYPPYSTNPPPPPTGPAQGSQPLGSNPIPDMPGTVFKNPFGDEALSQDWSFMYRPHCPIRIFTTKTKPWESESPLFPIESGTQRNLKKVMVPVDTSVKDLMQNFGCTNPDAKKNRVYEIVEAGNGRWKKGMEIGGDEKDKVKKAIKDYHWDETRTGKTGKPPSVWLYMTNE